MLIIIEIKDSIDIKGSIEIKDHLVKEYKNYKLLHN